MDSPTSSVVPPGITLAEILPLVPLVDPRANQPEEEGPGPTLTTMLTEFCAFAIVAILVLGIEDSFSLYPFCLLLEGD